ncbi:MAG: VTT domain-containing protein [Nanoarchaeota archaeon]|nr:VTT domain-containing protein [Nanoarchaeota archaeon]MBU4086918.1 VTT domain-containing protein [Nanoarchaeota archaeon]
MKKRSLTFLVSLGLLVVSIALIVALNVDFLKSAIGKNIQAYGYPSVFIFSFLADSVDQPIGPEVPASFAVIFGLDPLYIFGLSVFGSWIVSSINFYIGKRFLSKKIRGVCGRSSRNRVCNLFKKYGKAEILIASLTPVPYVSSCWAAGAFGMKFRDFFVFGMLARALRIGFFVNLVSYLV